jgi:hypothetical protein
MFGATKGEGEWGVKSCMKIAKIGEWEVKSCGKL